MSELLANGRVTLYCGDMLDIIKTLADNSIDSVVVDPPYHLTSIVQRFGDENAKPALSAAQRRFAETGGADRMPGTDQYGRLSKGFMGKVWDGGDVAFRAETWREVLRVLKPGGHLCAFSGTRTYHDMAHAIALAGFQIRDMLAWIYGSGFPKSHDISKAIDKSAGADREIVGRKTGRAATPVQDIRGGSYAGGNGKNGAADCSAITLPATELAKRWEGWGTALKPALEPICLARKPISEKTIAKNVLAHGTGALNVDACRVNPGERVQGGGKSKRGAQGGGIYGDGESTHNADSHALGRWPANVITDGSDEVVEMFPESSANNGVTKGCAAGGIWSGSSGKRAGPTHGDSGSAARFFASFPQDESWLDEVTLEWNSDRGPCRARLMVATEQSLGRVIDVSGSATSSEWNTFLFGNSITDLFRTASTCIIETKTNSTTTSPTWHWLTNLLTNEFTADVSYETANGGSLAGSVDSGATSLIITSEKTVFLPSHAASKTPLKISVNARHMHQIPANSPRLHYTSKADADDRLGSHHPTIKPLDLMQWLVRLVTPPGGIVLDPFAGTGTTGEAAFREGFHAVLIEREPEYQNDIRRRMSLVLGGKDERRREAIKAGGKADMDPGPLFR
jgi:site-specific DNA-methyltransferase (adenine-specific)